VGGAYTDNQSAIREINKLHRQSEQAIIKDFLDCVDDINDKYPHHHIKIIWKRTHGGRRKESGDTPINALNIQPQTIEIGRTRIIKETVRIQ
jgi:hypothetical protein